MVDDDVSPKTSITYPILEREDKFPVYYPTVQTKVEPYANRREDKYDPVHYPVFVSNKVEPVQYPSLTHEVDLTSAAYPDVNDLATSMHDYTVSTSIGSQVPEVKKKVVTKPPSTSSTFEIKTPAVNLFSPPIETEGMFNKPAMCPNPYHSQKLSSKLISKIIPLQSFQADLFLKDQGL